MSEFSRPNSTLMLLRVHREHGRAMLTLSTGETLIMPRALLKERPYRGGTPFDRAAFDALLRERAYPHALEKAIALLAMRPRTKREIQDALRQNAYDDSIILRVMDRLLEAGYLNDEDFAEQWTTSRMSKGMGARRIRTELRQKGVNTDTIKSALSDIDEDTQFEAAIKVAEKTARSKDLSSPSDRQKITATLIRRGFDFTTARKAIQQLQSTEKGDA